LPHDACRWKGARLFNIYVFEAGVHPLAQGIVASQPEGIAETLR
jgi:hypothetical protein